MEIKHYYHVMVTKDNKFYMYKQGKAEAGDVDPVLVNHKDEITLADVFNTLYEVIN
tara:strand:- start:159 stop:326 length:168 start_codon:yes stop_codon:yes gene_type:complete